MTNKEVKRILFDSKTNKPVFLAQLKANLDYEKFRKITPIIKTHHFGKQLLSATPLPKSLSDLRKNKTIPYTDNIESEIAWIIDSILEHAEKLNIFIDLKTKYEKAFLLNKYDQAEKILSKIENDICYSNWGIENKLLLTESQSGTENNWLLTSNYLKRLKDPLSIFFVEQNSKKAEKNYSYFRFKSNFENIIQDVGDLIFEYLCFKTLYTGYSGFNHYSFFLNIESSSSLIDRYLLLIDIFIELVPRKNPHFLINPINELLCKIPNDTRLKQLFNMLSDGFCSLSDQRQVTEIIDEYSIGNYDHCVTKGIRLLEQYPTSIETYVIYVKSLIEDSKEYKPSNVSENIDKILKGLYAVFSADEGLHLAMEDLLKTSLKLFSFGFGKQLYGVINKKISLDKTDNTPHFYDIVNSEIHNSKLLNYLDEVDSKISKNIFQNFETFKNISAKINLYINNGDFEKLEQNQEIPDNRKQIYIARAMLKSNSYEKLIPYLEKISTESQYSIITKQEIIEMLYNAYIAENRSEEALNLYIESFFDNSNLVNKLDTSKLYNQLKTLDEPIKSINLPIFFHQSISDVYEQYVEYDNFLEFNELEKPTGLITNHSIAEKKIIYFLKEVCSIEIMHQSIYFDGTDDIENERINLLKHLLTVDKNNEAEYIKEITEITQKTKIRKAIQEVNKGRITVNAQQLKNQEENNIKENFLRFKELLAFSNIHDIKFMDVTPKMLNAYLEGKTIVNINDPAYVTFKSMFVDLRDKFILSKDFGLDGYLSTRIRHGTFLNHIRSIFESFNLISQKQNNEYIDNPHWLDAMPTTLEGKQKNIQLALKAFSKEIDELTEDIIKEQIQVKTEKHGQKPKAFFDFTLNDQALAYLFEQSKSPVSNHTEFLNFVLEYLEATTNINLKKIRKHFASDIKNKYTQIIDELDKNIRKIIGNNLFINLTNSIVTCRTNIQNELDNIAEWFNISNPSTDNFLDIETIIKTAVEISNTIYPKQQMTPNIVVQSGIHLIGEINLIYAIRILLDNIIKHSNIHHTNYNASIKAETLINNRLRLSVSNKINSSNEKYTIQKLNEVKEKWGKEEDFSKSNIEGGSGFDKIRRILSVDMKMTAYDFDFEIDDTYLTIHIFMQTKQH